MCRNLVKFKKNDDVILNSKVLCHFDVLIVSLFLDELS